MARRRARKGNKAKAGSRQLLWVIGGVAVAAVAATLVFKPSGAPAPQEISDFRVPEYRERGGSTFIGNHYVLEGKVENIVSRANDRLVAVALPGNSRERLPLLVKGGSSVNISRGNSYIFEVDCVTGQDAEGLPVKGVFVVKSARYK